MVANEVKEGLKYYKFEKIQKNCFVAIATDMKEDNHGLPFWIGKVVQKKRECRDLLQEGEEVDEETLEDGALVEEWTQSQTNVAEAGKGSFTQRRYAIKVEAPPPGKKRSTKGVRTWIPTSTILYQFEKLTSTKSISKDVASWVAFNAEVMLKSESTCNPVGVAELNAELGYKMVPKRV